MLTHDFKLSITGNLYPNAIVQFKSFDITVNELTSDVAICFRHEAKVQELAPLKLRCMGQKYADTALSHPNVLTKHPIPGVCYYIELHSSGKGFH